MVAVARQAVVTATETCAALSTLAWVVTEEELQMWKPQIELKE